MSSPVPAICEFDEATIANGASLSGAINCGGRILTGVYMPATWSAANLTFQASPDGLTYYNVYDVDLGTEYIVTAAASLLLIVKNINLFPARYLKVRSGTAGSPVNQGGDRTLILAMGKPTTST